MTEKAALYLANGAQMVWLLYPELRIVEVLTATDRQLLTEQASVTGGDVLPGFDAVVGACFPPQR
jgi:hypothetical protein